jgi:hypothetical protein
MAYTLLVMAEARWRKVNAPPLLPLVQTKVKGVDGMQPRKSEDEGGEGGRLIRPVRLQHLTIPLWDEANLYRRKFNFALLIAAAPFASRGRAGRHL